MGEILPDGSIQGYSGYCDKCAVTISTNIQGNEMGKHECVPVKVPEQIGCIIPIWGNAVNKGLKEFITWFNENYTVTKK